MVEDSLQKSLDSIHTEWRSIRAYQVSRHPNDGVNSRFDWGLDTRIVFFSCELFRKRSSLVQEIDDLRLQLQQAHVVDA